MKRFDELDIIIPISLDLDWPKKDDIIAEIRERHENYGFTRFALACPCGGWRAIGYPPTEFFAERAAGMPEGDSEIGGLRVIVKNGVAYLRDMTAFAGSVATTDRLVRVMHKQVGIPLPDCITMMCKTPARVMNLARRGELRPGYFADLVFFDGDINIKKF